MDFTKFVSLLDTGALFFARADKLGDPYEGSFSKPDLTLYLKELEHLGADYLARTRLSMHSFMVLTSYVSCWHMNNYESAAMWNYYARQGAGIALATTLKDFKDSFLPMLPKDRDIYIGRVSYVDYDTSPVAGNNGFNLLLHKRKSFEHETEARAICTTMGDLTEVAQLETQPAGLRVPVNLQQLIAAVYVAPETPSWLLDLVHSILAKYGLENMHVYRSSLADKALV